MFTKKYLSLVDRKTTSRREGGISSVPLKQLTSYLQYITQRNQRKKNKKWLKSIHQLNDLINSDPILRMNWQYGIYMCNQTLKGKSGDDILEMLDTICKTPPSFSHSSLVGFPINAVLIQFMQTQNGRTFFSHQRVNQAIKKILDDYGKMLLTAQSTKYLTKQENGWFSPEAEAVIHNDWYQCDPNLPNYGYKNWNQWFLRQFKDGLRPIGQGSPEGVDPFDVIVNSCESAPLTNPKQPQTNVQFSDKFWFKDDVYSLNDMFGGKKYKKEHIAHHFQGGTVYQAFLSALFYHRWHSPVDGTIEDVYGIDGTYYLDQSQFIGYDQGSPNNSESFLSAVAARKVIVINAKNKKIGKIAIVYIGMAEVSSCVSVVKVGDVVKKGQQIGYFMFGGSSHAIVFQKKANLKFKSNFYLFNEELQTFESQKQNLFSYLAHVQQHKESQVDNGEKQQKSQKVQEAKKQVTKKQSTRQSNNI